MHYSVLFVGYAVAGFKACQRPYCKIILERIIFVSPKVGGHFGVNVQ